MKAPNHATPSGDRTIAQLFMKMLHDAGNDVQLVSSLRSLLHSPDALPGLSQKAAIEIKELIDRFNTSGAYWRPEIWLTYHNYYKAPDLVGPHVARALKIPYVIAEPSIAPRHETTKWSDAYRLVMSALQQAAHLWAFNKKDLSVLQRFPELGPKATLLTPFVDGPPPQSARTFGKHKPRVPNRTHRVVRLITVAMARPGKKQHGYRELCTIMDRLPSQGWHLFVVGDVNASTVSMPVKSLTHHPRITIVGQVAREALWRYFASADLFVWPGLQETVGMSVLEAQSSGLPVIAYHTAGTDMTIQHGVTGLLATNGERQQFATNVRTLLASHSHRSMMGRNAKRRAKDQFNIESKGRQLSKEMAKIVASGQQC